MQAVRITRLSVVLVALSLLLAGCFAISRPEQPRLLVEWTVTPVPRNPATVSFAALQAEDTETPEDTAIEAERELGWASTPVQTSVVRVRAWLVGSTVPDPVFDFEVASERPIVHYREANNVLAMEPDSANRGVVRVTHGSLETLVPFEILPSAFLTAWPERYDWARGPVALGIILPTGELTNDSSAADLYVDARGEVYAPYGWAQIAMQNPWNGLTQELDATQLEFRPGGPLGIAGAEGIPDLAFPYLWVVKTGDGGYARFKFQSVRWNQDWEIIYEYSATGQFNAR